NPNDILFIDASQQFDKVKTQNILRPVHIQKIVDSYLVRTHEDKYSAVASLEAIKANDYNLNIPRYVDTFEAEDAIDLNAIAEQLEALDQKSQQTDSTIAAFCQELGIAPPFAVLRKQA
ncbi:MAG: N-6 DNA methylase, partial [Nitrosomonas sp.]|nr:N-6 DNA methylase [Nitrosomonas sp.]